MANLLQPVIYKMLLTVARLCISRAVLCREAELLLRRAFLEASQEFLNAGQLNSISKLSVLTGLQRRQVKQLLDSSAIAQTTTNLLTRVVGTWAQSSNYQDANGTPRPLSCEGEDSEFFELVESITQDVSPYTVLFALEHSKIISRIGQNVTLKVNAFVPTEDEVGGLDMLAEDISDLCSAVNENLELTDSTPHLHLTTVYDNITEEASSELREWILKRGTEFQQEVRTHLSKLDKDFNPTLHAKKGGVRVAVCTFSHISTEKNSSKGTV